jgi:putative colanic acid biosynthesis acetyltransferase WcaF
LETNLGKFNNSEYWKSYNTASKFKILLWFFVNSIFINSYLPFPIVLKVFLLKIFGAKLGNGIVLKPKVNIKYPWFLEIGHNVWIGEEVWIDNLDFVNIGDNACISQGALLLTGNHDYTKETFDMRIGKIIIENGVWIGARAIVCQNVTCKSHSILTVGSVTSSNLEPYGIYKGNPAILQKTRVIKN